MLIAILGEIRRTKLDFCIDSGEISWYKKSKNETSSS
jgi:hypothetical protein